MNTVQTNIISKREYYQDLYQACKFIADVSNEIDSRVTGAAQLGSWSFLPYSTNIEYIYEDKFRFDIWPSMAEIIITGVEPSYRVNINLCNSPEDCIKTLEEINNNHSDIIFDILQLRDILPNILFESMKKTDEVLEYAKGIVEACEDWKEHVKQLLNKKSCLQS